MTSPSWPVRVSWPLPFISEASTARVSPPTWVQARPVATPSGSVPACVELMNARAAKLGMTRTRYDDCAGFATGVSQASDETTARDVARLAQALVHQRQVLEWTSL